MKEDDNYGNGWRRGKKDMTKVNAKEEKININEEEESKRSEGVKEMEQIKKIFPSIHLSA